MPEAASGMSVVSRLVLLKGKLHHLVLVIIRLYSSAIQF